MEITVNGEERSLEVDSCSVDELLAALEVEQTSGVAIAVNDRVVSRSSWKEATVAEGDSVEIIRATQGG